MQPHDVGVAGRRRRRSAGAVQVPQLRVPPQPSAMVPQLSPAGQVVAACSRTWLAVPPPPQVCGAAQVPQLTMPPQPSGTVPQLSPAGQSRSGVQPHTLGVAAAAAGLRARVQVPQLTRAAAAVGDRAAVVAGAGSWSWAVQPHWLGVPGPPPQVCGGGAGAAAERCRRSRRARCRSCRRAGQVVMGVQPHVVGGAAAAAGLRRGAGAAVERAAAAVGRPCRSCRRAGQRRERAAQPQTLGGAAAAAGLRARCRCRS